MKIYSDTQTKITVSYGGTVHIMEVAVMKEV